MLVLDKFRKKFATHLKVQLKKRYMKAPPASLIANEFNLRAKDISSISPESVRQWLSGLSFPTADQLTVLRKWLDIQTEFFDQE